MQLHPDRPNGSEEKFMAVQAAYDTLSDPESRKYYNRTGQTELPKVDQKVQGLMMAIFNEILTNKVKGDLIKESRNGVSTAIGKLKTGLQQVQYECSQFEKKADRIIAKTGHNLYRQLVDTKIAEAKQKIAVIEEEIVVFEGVLEALKDYKDTAPDPVTQTGAFTFVTSTSTA